MTDDNTQGNLFTAWGYDPWMQWHWDHMFAANKTLANAQCEVLARFLKARFPTGVRAFLTADHESDRTHVTRVVDSEDRELFSGYPEDLGPHRWEIEWMLQELTSSPTQWADEIWEAGCGDHEVYELELPERGPSALSDC